MSSDSARSNQSCACAETPSSAAGAGGPETSAAFADELTTAMAIAATQNLVVILIALSPQSDLDTPILGLSHVRIGGDRQFRLALGHSLESVRRNATGE